MPSVILIAGANGAGKTTFAANLLPLAYPEALFLNADEIQRDRQFATPLSAGRELLRRLAVRIDGRDDVAIETTLSSAGYARMFPGWRRRGYRISVHYLDVVSADFAVARVARRVAAGGHPIPEDDVRRRHARGKLLFEALYRSEADLWYRYAVDEEGLRRVDQGQNPR